MLPTANDVLSYLQNRAVALARDTDFPTPDAVDPREYRRSPAASRVAELSVESGHHHFHFERRAIQPLPEAWVPEAEPELAEPPQWHDGILPEPKYQSFRHDLPIGSYHPHHRAKWASHELCHALVGCAWNPRATHFFHATAARLAEMVPVALWYFFDESFVQRCPLHQGDGALFKVHCPDCEELQAARVDDPRAAERIVEGLNFLERELAAITRSRRLGRQIPHRWATINLASDGDAYARSHGPRLSSPLFARFAEDFFLPGGFVQPTLDDLEARVHEVVNALLIGERLTPQAPGPRQGQWRWMLQDLGWRLSVETLHTPALRQPLQAMIDQLAGIIPLTSQPWSSTIEQSLESRWNEVLTSLWDLSAEQPALRPPHELLALGYDGPVPGLDSGWAPLTDGLETIAPLSVPLLGEDLEDVVDQFAHDDPFVRRPLVRRWADWVTRNHGPRFATVAAWEAIAGTLPTRPFLPTPGPALGDEVQLTPGVVVAIFDDSALELAEAVESGAMELEEDDDGELELYSVDGSDLPAEDCAFILGRLADGDSLLLEIDPELAESLRELGEGGHLNCTEEEQQALEDHGVIQPARTVELS